jgi:hypothetical protein
MEYDIATGNRHGKGEADVDHDGIAWVSGQGGTRGATDPLHATDTFLLEVAGITPHGQDGGALQADWFLA